MVIKVPVHSDVPQIGPTIGMFDVETLDATPSSPLRVVGVGQDVGVNFLVTRATAQNLITKLAAALRGNNSK
jgi:hypothetical protein